MFSNWLIDLIHFVFSELELTEKFAALVPPPQKNGVSYHGVLAPRHRFRNAVIPEPPAESDPKPRLTKTPKVGRSRWHPWADLLWRVFEVDGLACPCGRRLVLHAVVRPPATFDALESLERSAAARQPRAPPQVPEGCRRDRLPSRPSNLTVRQVVHPARLGLT